MLLSSGRRRAAVAALAVLGGFLTRGYWLPALGRTLVCEQKPLTAQAVVLDNFDNEYGLFKWGAEFQHAGKRVVVPVTAAEDHDSAVAGREVAATFARVAGLSQWDRITVQEKEPISLHTAFCVRDVLLSEHITSVTLVSNGFRSRRSELIYRSVLGERGITASCLPVFGTVNPDNWTATWHGIEDVALQFIKLQYYRFWVMPRHRAPRGPQPPVTGAPDADACRMDRIGM